MKKILQLTKAIILTLVAVIMLLNTNVLTAYAGTIMFPDSMQKTEDGKIMIVNGITKLTTDNTGRDWYIIDGQYPFCMYKGEIEVIFRGEKEIATVNFLDCYLTDYIETHDESEWPSFVVKGSDGVPFYYSIHGDCPINTLVKFCYDKESGWWNQDRKAKTYRTWECSGTNGLAQDIREAIENGETINGAAEEPITPSHKDKVVDSDDVPVTPTNPTEPEEPVNPPTEGDEIKDPYADVNTLGATVTLKTDCIKVKTNKKGVIAQKPLPGSVKVDKKALKKNKTYTVSYEKYTDGWNAVDAVTDEGIYRLVITGKNGYEGVYKKRLYVTADKTIKAMSSVAVKVNKVAYTGNPITTGVIKTAKIGKRTLVEGTDYTVTYKNNTDSGIGQVILTAKDGSGLLGTKTVNFTITGNKITKAKVEGLQALTYSPNTEMVQDFRYGLRLTYDGKTIWKDVDYTVSYVNNTKAGTAKIVFTGKGLYNGTLTKTFKINKAPLSENMLDNASKNIKVTYTGKALNPEVTLKIGDKTLKKGTDYTLTYKNNVKVSTAVAPAQITVKGKGNYTGSFKVDFSVIAKSNGVDEKSNAKSIKSDEEVDNLTEDGVIADEPTEDEAVTDEPIEDAPVTDEPTEDEPATDEPTEDKPATDEPTGNETATDEPTEGETAIDEPTKGEAVTDEPTEGEAGTDEPAEGKAGTDESTIDKPTADEPAPEDVEDTGIVDAETLENEVQLNEEYADLEINV